MNIQIVLPNLHRGQRMVKDTADRFSVLMCGRRVGKTTLGEYLACSAALDRLPVAWFAPTYKLLSDPWRDIGTMLRPVVKTTSVQERRMTLINGGTIDFWTMDSPDPGRGRKYGLVVLDEVSLSRNIEEAWNAAIRPTLTDLKGRAFFLFTPKGRGFPFRLYNKGKSGDDGWRSFNLETADNPFMDRKEIEAAKKDLPPHIFDQEYRGIPADDAGNPFGLSAIQACVHTLSDAKVEAWGVDLAKSQDWTVCIGLDAKGRTARFERWQAVPWPETLLRIRSIVGDCPALVDSTGVGAPAVEELQRHIPRVEGFLFTGPSKQELMGRLAVAIQGQEVTYPDSPIVCELESFEYQYCATGVKYSAPSGLHDDCVCALALARRKLDSVLHGEGSIIYTVPQRDPIGITDKQPRADFAAAQRAWLDED